MPHRSIDRVLSGVDPYTLLHPFNGLFSRTTWVSRHQKGKPFWILLEQEMMGWQRHQLDHMQIICTSLQTDNHASTSLLNFFYRLDALPATQPTASEHEGKSGPTYNHINCANLGILVWSRCSVHQVAPMGQKTS